MDICGEELNIRISDGRKSDIDALALLEQRCFPVPWSWESIAREITQNDSARFYLAELKDRVIGCASCWLIPPYECQVGNLAVAPEYRRQGVAKALMKALIEGAESEGIMDITLEVRVSNLAAQALYKGLGFESEGLRRGYYQGKEDAVIMWRREKLAERRAF